MNRLVAYNDYQHGAFCVLITGVDEKQEVIDCLLHAKRSHGLPERISNWKILTEEEAEQRGIDVSLINQRYSFEEFKKERDEMAARAAREARYGKNKLLWVVFFGGWRLLLFMAFVVPLLLIARGLRCLERLLRKHLEER